MAVPARSISFSSPCLHYNFSFLNSICILFFAYILLVLCVCVCVCNLRWIGKGFLAKLKLGDNSCARVCFVILCLLCMYIPTAQLVRWRFLFPLWDADPLPLREMVGGLEERSRTSLEGLFLFFCFSYKGSNKARTTRRGGFGKTGIVGDMDRAWTTEPGKPAEPGAVVFIFFGSVLFLVNKDCLHQIFMFTILAVLETNIIIP